MANKELCVINTKNELQNRDMHISGYWKNKKVEIQSEKVNIEC